MKNRLMLALAILCLLFLTSCEADPSELVYSSDVDNRFSESLATPDKPPLTIAATSFSFLIITDTHINGGKNTNLESLRSQKTPEDQFILVCGDITQKGDLADFESLADYLGPAGLPVFTTPGNHDLYFNGWANYKQVFGRSCYALSADPILIISMDSANGTIGKKQKEWLEGVLKAKIQPLCIVFTHFEFFSPDPSNIQQFSDIEEVYYLMHLFETYGVNYVFMGHAHADDYRSINGVNYLTIIDLTDDSRRKAFIRVKVNGTKISHERIEL